MCGTVSLGAARSRLFAGHREQKTPQICSSLAWAASPGRQCWDGGCPHCSSMAAGKKLSWASANAPCCGCHALSLKQLRVAARSSPARLFSAISLAVK